MITKLNPESLSSQQQAALVAIDNLCDNIRNHDHFSDADIARILSEVKGVVHTTYKEAFKEPAFSWQVDHYMIQMTLENKYSLIIKNDMKLTWDPTRWEYALITEHGIRYYKQTTNGEGIIIPEHGLQIMALWLFFQFFKANVFTGPQCMKVVELAYQIVKDAGTAIRESVQVIKQWRRDNDKTIQSINYQKTEWRREVAKYDRLIYGRMRLKEVEIHHIFYWSHPDWTFEQNVKSASCRLGVSEKGIKRILSKHGYYEHNLWGYLTVLKEEMDAKYEEELKWAERVRSKTLTKKEQKEFWRRHSIINPRSKFRTFSSLAEDLIPASNPLLTDETCVAPKQEDTAQTTDHSVWESQANLFSSPLQMGSLTSCFNSMYSNNLFEF